MAELAVSAFAAMTSSAAAAGTAVAGAASSLSTLSGAATALSMASTLFAGLGSWRASSDQAKMARVDARGDEIAAEAAALRIKREYVQAIGHNRVAFAASGLDISSGAEIEGSLASQAEFEAGNALSSGAMSAAGKRMQAAGYASRGTSSLIAAAARAGGQYANYRIDLARRG